MVVETQMDSAIPRDAHAYRVVLIKCLLNVVGECESLPVAQAGRNATPSEVHIMFSIASCCFVERHVLVVAKGRQGVLLECESVQMH